MAAPLLTGCRAGAHPEAETSLGLRGARGQVVIDYFLFNGRHFGCSFPYVSQLSRDKVHLLRDQLLVHPAPGDQAAPITTRVVEAGPACDTLVPTLTAGTPPSHAPLLNRSLHRYRLRRFIDRIDIPHDGRSLVTRQHTTGLKLSRPRFQYHA